MVSAGPGSLADPQVEQERGGDVLTPHHGPTASHRGLASLQDWLNTSLSHALEPSSGFGFCLVKNTVSRGQ